MNLSKIIDILENWAPLSHAEDFDNVGLLVGDVNSKIDKALITLDTTNEVIEEAIEKKCNLVITFHPLIFEPLKSINYENRVQKIIIKAIKNNINIYCIHTNLDNNSRGVNYKICQKLKIKPKKNQKLFFTKIKYKDKIFGDRILKISNLTGKEIVLITGIAETKSIEKYFNEKKIKFKHLKYSDHHKYSKNDLNVIKKISKNKNVLTTKKDYYKLKENINNLFYLDIETNFLKDELIFQEEINKLIN